MARLLLLLPTTAYQVSDFLAAARRLNITVAVGSDKRQVLEAHSAGRTLTVDFRDRRRGVAQIVAAAATDPFRAVVGVDDKTAVLAAEAAAALGLPHNPPSAVLAASDKHRLREVLAAGDVLSPGFRVLGADADVALEASQVRYPCVAKPLALSASRGVIRADDGPALETAVARIRRLLARPDAGGTSGAVLVEDYVPGPEVALEGLLDQGRLTVLALFDKPDPLEGPYFEETLYVTPSRRPVMDQQAMVQTVERAAAVLGLRHGPVHAELRSNSDGHWVIELAARSIGGLCGRSLRFGTDMSLEEVVLRQALGLPLPDLSPDRASGVMMLPIPRRGALRGVDGQDAARAVSGIEDLVISIPVGQEVEPLPEGARYLGFLFARGDTPEIVEDALREAFAAMRIDIAAAETVSA